jgi:UDP-N-acetylmuramate: L-alanyl-gamma-D-glutamyl-meso-diaminopimelate ligase
MHIHILGICGTFMGSLAILARELGHKVSGCDANVYPPMSTQLERAGIEIYQGFDESQFDLEPDLVVIGNAMSRGNPAVEYVLNSALHYTSGPQWLCEQVLQDRWVLACSGTHGKTTTSSMLAWILEYAGMSPGYLIGGVPKNFDVSARLGDTPFFVIEADEYDSAFFDKRSKFVHYRPRTAIINNLEFDHADIFDSIEDIQKQFHHMVRIVPSNGMVIAPKGVEAIDQVLAKGCWSDQQSLSVGDDKNIADDNAWQATLASGDGSEFDVAFAGVSAGRVVWSHTGEHNVSNGLAAIAAARHVGVTPDIAVKALSEFAGVKRRMECLADLNLGNSQIKIYDDFAHHPTAIATTLQGLRAQVGEEKIIVLIEPRSNTMRMGVHQSVLGKACVNADDVLWYKPEGVDWDLDEVVHLSPVPAKLISSLDDLIADAKMLAASAEKSHIVIMSNGGFGGVHEKLINSFSE